MGAPVSTLTAIQQVESPQFQALQWMLLEEETISAWPDWRVQQLFAAATLGFATNLGGGNGDRRWFNSYDECNFIGVTCNDSGMILQLDVTERNRGGELPDEIAMFTSLTSFIGRRNRYTGQIPAAFGYLPFLETLILDQNSLTGNLPKSLENLSDSLVTLTVDRNELSGEFPNSLLSQLTSLRIFSGFGNQFTGDIAESICVLPSLQSFVTDCENEGCYTQCI